MLRYQRTGQGPALLLVHGLGISHTIWRELTPLLSPHFSLISVELPCIGDSSLLDPAAEQSYHANYYKTAAQEVQNLQKELGLATWHLLGYSLGAQLCHLLIEQSPQGVDKAVFLCPGIFPGWRWRALGLFGRVDDHWPRFGSWILSGWRLRTLIRLLGFNGRSHPLVGEWTSEIRAQPIQSLRRMLKELPSSGREILQQPVPTLYLWGKEDWVVSPPHRLGPHDRLISGGHAAPMISALEIAGVAIEFLQ